MKDITIILTSVGGPIAASYIKCLKLVTERNVSVIGVDSSDEIAGRYLVDKFYQVPPASREAEYVQAMLDISAKNGIDAIVPSSEPESLALSKNRKQFERIGTKLVCPEYESVKLSSDKALFCEILKKHNLPFPELYLVKTVSEFKEAAKNLGHPAKPIIMKPRFGTGSRGVRILDAGQDRQAVLFNEKPEQNIFSDMKEMEELLKDNNFPELVVSEYLPKGIEYSTEILARHGEMLICVPKLRMKKIVGLSLNGVVDRNPEVEELSRQICRAFNFHYNFNIQFKYSADGQLVPFEINPRIAASIILSAAAGANLLYYGVKLALGEDIPKVEIKNGTKMFRHLQEVFVQDNNFFTL